MHTTYLQKAEMIRISDCNSVVDDDDDDDDDDDVDLFSSNHSIRTFHFSLCSEHRGIYLEIG